MKHTLYIVAILVLVAASATVVVKINVRLCKIWIKKGPMNNKIICKGKFWNIKFYMFINFPNPKLAFKIRINDIK